MRPTHEIRFIGRRPMPGGMVPEAPAAGSPVPWTPEPGARLDAALTRLRQAVRAKVPPRPQVHPATTPMATGKAVRRPRHVGWLAYLFGRLMGR
jgi:hypothetical protein